MRSSRAPRTIAYRQLQLLAGQHLRRGLGRTSISRPTKIRPPQPAEPEHGRTSKAGLQTDRVDPADPASIPFPPGTPIQRTSMRIEPSIYLETLMRDVCVFGGRIVIRKFDSPRDLMALPEPVIVNCSGLGSFDLFGDKELMPVKGQLTVLVPQAEVNYQTSGGVQRAVHAGHRHPHDAEIRRDRPRRDRSARRVDDGAGRGRAEAGRRRAHRAVLGDAVAAITFFHWRWGPTPSAFLR